MKNLASLGLRSGLPAPMTEGLRFLISIQNSLLWAQMGSHNHGSEGSPTVLSKQGKDLLFVCVCSPHRGRYLQRLEKVLDPQELELQLWATSVGVRNRIPIFCTSTFSFRASSPAPGICCFFFCCLLGEPQRWPSSSNCCLGSFVICGSSVGLADNKHA